MINIQPRDTQLIIPQGESLELSKELEEAFCKLDGSTSGTCFSGEEIKKKFPTIYKLYRNL